MLPTYNERENLESVVAAVLKGGHDVLIVDDSSADGTGELAEHLASFETRVQVLHRSHKLGLGTAYLAGFKVGLKRGYRFLIEMDADGSHDPDDLRALIDAARHTNGLSIGSRYVKDGAAIGWSLQRRVLSRAANFYCRALLGRRLRDWTSGYRCYSAEVFDRIGLQTIISEGFSFQIELAFRCLEAGVPVVEVPIHFRERALGKSKASGAEISKALKCVAGLRKNVRSATDDGQTRNQLRSGSTG